MPQICLRTADPEYECQFRKPPSTPHNPTVERLTLRLLDDESWQGMFTDDERAVWLDAAKRYWRLQRKAGFDLNEGYARVLAMLKAVNSGQ